jgi:hypothetical protein
MARQVIEEAQVVIQFLTPQHQQAAAVVPPM